MNDKRDKAPVIRVGRITAALVLVVVGILLLVDQFYGTNSMLLLLTWWPLILISWGLEAIWFRVIRSKRKWRIDVLGMFTALFISSIIFTVTQPNMFRDWLRSIQFDFSMMKQMALLNGNVVEQSPVYVKLVDDISLLDINHLAGDIYMKTGTVEQMELNTLVTVYDSSKEEAELVAEQIVVEVLKDAETKHWTLRVNGLDQYRQKGMNIAVNIEAIIPEHNSFPITVKVRDGDVHAQRLKGGIRAVSTNGDLSGEQLEGDVVMESNRGDIDVRSITGNVTLHTNGGDITVSDVSGDVKTVTQSGDLSLNSMKKRVHAESLNGHISIVSSVMGGDWEVQALAGDVDIELPPIADVRVRVHNSFGELDSNFPLSANEDAMETVLGRGIYQLAVEVNGDLLLK